MPPHTICVNFLINFFLKLSNALPKYAVNNTFEFVEQTKNLTIPNNATLVSFDVKGLFTSIPTTELKDIIHKDLNNSQTTINIQEIIALNNLCIDQSYFRFNDKFFIQKEGLPMGSPLSPLLAELFMKNFENHLFNIKNPLIKNIHFWRRYVDDVFCVWTGTERQLQQFLSLLNSLNTKIQFTIEKETDHSINFLDLTIINQNNQLTYQIYRKPTTTDIVIPADSKHPEQTKLAAFNSMIHRLINIPLSENSYNKELDIIQTIALNNGYPTALINKILKKKLRQKTQKLLYRGRPLSSNVIYSSIRYTGHTSQKISQKLKNHKLIPIQVNKNNLGKYLANSKIENKDKLSHSGVYQIQCDDCDAIYIGQTGRNFNTRLKEHKTSILKNQNKTGIADHCITNNHSISNNIKPIYTQNKGKKLNLLETLAIKKALKNRCNVVNNQIEIPSGANIILNSLII